MTSFYGIAGDIYDRLLADGYVGGVRTERGTGKAVYPNRATLTFKRGELMYDIKNLAFVEGDVMATDDDHDRHQVMDIGEDGNVDRVTRVLDLAIAHCRELLFPYSRTDVGAKEERDDTFEEPEEYMIELRLPADFSKSTLDYLEKLIHEYLVYRVLMDWLSITNQRNPSSAATWGSKLESLEDEIGSTLNARIGRVRRTQSPF